MNSPDTRHEQAIEAAWRAFQELPLEQEADRPRLEAAIAAYEQALGGEGLLGTHRAILDEVASAELHRLDECGSLSNPEMKHRSDLYAARDALRAFGAQLEAARDVEREPTNRQVEIVQHAIEGICNWNGMEYDPDDVAAKAQGILTAVFEDGGPTGPTPREAIRAYHRAVAARTPQDVLASDGEREERHEHFFHPGEDECRCGLTRQEVEGRAADHEAKSGAVAERPQETEQ